MKSLIYSILILSISTIASNAQKEEGIHTVWTSIDNIEGSLLMRFDSSSAPVADKKNSTNTCSIGYMKKSGKDKKSSFISVLSLPSLTADTYITKIVDGHLHVTTKNGGKMLLILNLKDIAPTLLAERH